MLSEVSAKSILGPVPTCGDLGLGNFFQREETLIGQHNWGDGGVRPVVCGSAGLVVLRRLLDQYFCLLVLNPSIFLEVL